MRALVEYEDVELKWNGNLSIPSFLKGTFFRGAPGQWPDAYWLDGLITLNAFKFQIPVEVRLMTTRGGTWPERREHTVFAIDI